MIVKLIRMNRDRTGRSLTISQRKRVRELRQAVFGLTRYVVDADPFSLIETERDILSLSDYALAIQKTEIEPGEKVEAHGSRNLVSDDLASWQAQMLAVAVRAPRVRSPVLHAILSLKEDETWTAQEREEAIDIVLETLGLERCPVVWAEHCDTDNPHIHLSVVRVDPRTGKAAGSDWLIDDLHQAAALIEERQGRAREPDALYVAKRGAVYDSETGTLVRDHEGHFQAGWHKTLGRKRSRLPAEVRVARTELLAAVDRSRGWSDFHAACAENELVYDRAGSGARIGAGERFCKASEVHPALSRGNLEKRWGAFEPDIHRLDPSFEAFRAALDGQLAELREARDREFSRLRAWASATISALPADQRGVLRAAIRSEEAEARNALNEAFSAAIRRCTMQRLAVEKWKEAGSPAYNHIGRPAVLFPNEADGRELGGPSDNSGLKTQVGWATAYLDDRGQKLFTDHGSLIVVQQIDRVSAIDEALLLGAAKWGVVKAFGPPTYLKLVSERAEALGLDLASPVADLPRERTPPHTSQGTKQTDRHQSKRGKISDLIERLEQYPTLALRRRQISIGDDGALRTGPIEILLRQPNSVGKRSVFSASPVLQDYLERRRLRALEQIENAIKMACLDPSVASTHNLIEVLGEDKDLQRSAAAMACDSDFQNFLTNLRENRPLTVSARESSTLKRTPNRSDNPSEEIDGEARGSHFDVTHLYELTRRLGRAGR